MPARGESVPGGVPLEPNQVLGSPNHRNDPSTAPPAAIHGSRRGNNAADAAAVAHHAAHKRPGRQVSRPKVRRNEGARNTPASDAAGTTARMNQTMVMS